MSAVKQLTTPGNVRRGALLVEVVIGLALGVLFGVAIVKMGIGTFDSVGQSRERLEAVHYASEGLEQIRTIGRQNFADLTLGTHGIQDTGFSFALSGSSDTYGKYTRSITIRPAYRDAGNVLLLDPANTGSILAAGGLEDTQARYVTSTVQWNEAGRNQSVALRTVVAKWYVYPLEQASESTGGTLYNANWTNRGAVLAHPATFSPPVILGSVAMPASNEVVDMVVDYNHVRLIVVTDQGNVRTYSLLKANEGVMPLIASTTIAGTLTDAELVGDFLYVTSTNNTSEVTVLRTDDLGIVNTWDLSGTTDALSVALVGGGQYLLVGRRDNIGDELYYLNPDPYDSAPVVQSVEMGADAKVIEAYTNDWAFIATDKTSAELQVVDVDGASVTSCNVQGAQVLASIDIEGNTLVFGRQNGPEGTVATFTLNPVTPTTCTTYDSPDWNNGLNTAMTQVTVDPYETLLYSVTGQTTNHFYYNDVSPSTVTPYTVVTGAACHRITHDQALLYIGCTTAGTDSVYILGGGGTERSGYVETGAYLFPPMDGGPFARWKALYWTSSGGVIRMQLRTATGAAELVTAEWLGPTGGTGSLYTVSGTPIRTGPYTNSGRWLQVRSILTRTGATTPSVSSVTVLRE